MSSDVHDQQLVFADVITGGFPPAVQAKWEAFLMSTATGQRYRNEIYNKIDREAEARGRAESLLDLLDDRGVDVPDGFRQLVLACTDVNQLRR